MFTRPFRGAAALLLAAGLLLGWRTQVYAQSAAPGAPSGLTYLVNNSAVSLFWTHSTGTFTHYVVEAGQTPGTTFFTYSTAGLVNPNTLPNLISAFSTGGVPPGNYYVRVRGANGAQLSAPSNEVLVPVSGGCQAPGTPTDFTTIVRGNFAYLQWNPGSGGLPAGYVLTASQTPGGPALVSFPLAASNLNVSAIPAGTYYVQVVARNACGQSGPTAQSVVTSPSTTAARTADPINNGRLPLPYVWDTVRAIAQSRPDLLASSCPSRPGYSDSDIEARKTQPNGFLNAVVAALRQIDQRFGYNSKPTRANAIVAGDEIAYHYGADAPEGSPNVHLVDVLSGHCTFGREEAVYRVFTNGEFGRWTSAGRF